MPTDVDYALAKLDWMRAERIWPSGDEYDREAITWVMACTADLPRAFLRDG